MIFETERLRVRPYTWDDFDDFFRLNSDEDVMRYIRPPQPYEKAKEFFAKILVDYEVQPGLGRWGAYTKLENIFVGSFAIIPIEKSTELQLGYALFKENWGKGYASEMTKAGIHYYFATTEREKVFALAETANLASHHVLLKNGFRPDAVIKEGEKELQRFIFTRQEVKKKSGA